MNRARWIGALALLGGCSQIFGLEAGTEGTVIDAPDGATADAPRDAPGIVTHGSWVVRNLKNGMIPPPRPRAAEITVFMDDLAPVRIPLDGEGNFSFERPTTGTPYRLQSPGPDGTLYQYESSAPLVTIEQTVASRYGAAPFTNATLSITDSTGDGALRKLQSTGVWTDSLLPDGPFNWGSSNFLGERGLLDSDLGDALYLTRFLAPNGYYRVTGVATADITLEDGPNNFAPAAVVPNLVCVGFNGRYGAERLRLELDEAPDPTSNWRLVAIPAESTGAVGALELAFADVSLSGDQLGSTPFSYTVFPDIKLALQLETQVALTLPGAPTAFRGSLTNVSVVGSSVACPTTIEVELGGSGVGLPTEIVVEGTRIDGEPDATITLPDHPITIEWALEGAAAELFRVTISSASIDIGDSTVPLVIETAAPSVRIDPAYFRSLEHYLVRVDAIRGRPNTAGGNFGALADDFGVTTNMAVFGTN